MARSASLSWSSVMSHLNRVRPPVRGADADARAWTRARAPAVCDGSMVADVGDSSQLSQSAAAIDSAAEAIVRVWTGPQSAPGVPVPATQLRVLFVVEQRGAVNLS